MECPQRLSNKATEWEVAMWRVYIIVLFRALPLFTRLLVSFCFKGHLTLELIPAVCELDVKVS